MTQKFDIKFLKDPKGVFPPPQTYYWIGQKGFSEANPQAREIIASVFVPKDDITAMNGAVKDGKTMDQAVAEWVAAPRRPDEALGKHQELLKHRRRAAGADARAARDTAALGGSRM